MNVFESINGTVRRLSHIRRYSSIAVVRQENVAEHSFYAGLYGQMVGLDLIDRGYQVDLGELAIKCIWHDFAEAMTGDMPRSFKYHDDEFRKQVSRVEEELVKRLYAELGWVNGGVFEYWLNAKDDSLEGKILSFVDMLCVIAYCREEYSMGNHSIDHVLEYNFYLMQERFKDSPLFGIYYDQLYPNNTYKDLYRNL